MRHGKFEPVFLQSLLSRGGLVRRSCALGFCVTSASMPNSCVMG